MRVAHLSNPGMVDKIGSLSPLVAVHPRVLRGYASYAGEVRRLSDSGQYIYLLSDGSEFPDGVDLDYIDEVAVPYHSDDEYDDFLDKVSSVPSGTGVSILLLAGDSSDMRDMYNSIRDIESHIPIASVAIPVSPLGMMESRDVDLGFVRVEFIRWLVDKGEFQTHIPHHLYGMLNPVEMALYHHEFGGFIRSSIRSVSSAALFLSALYGMRISEQTGFYHSPPSRQVEYVGTDVPHDLTIDLKFSSDQLRALRANNQVIHGFASGSGGDDVFEEYQAMKEFGI